MTITDNEHMASSMGHGIFRDTVYYQRLGGRLFVRAATDTRWVELHQKPTTTGWRLDSDVPAHVREHYIDTHHGTFLNDPDPDPETLAPLPLVPGQADPATQYRAVMVTPGIAPAIPPVVRTVQPVRVTDSDTWLWWDNGAEALATEGRRVVIVGVHATGCTLLPYTVGANRLEAALAEITRLQGEVQTLQRNAQIVENRVRNARQDGEIVERDRIRDLLIEEGERRDWCDELDDFLERCGMEPRTRDYTVEVSFTFIQYVTVNASNPDAAQEMVEEDIESSITADPFGSFTPSDSNVSLEYNIEGVEAD